MRFVVAGVVAVVLVGLIVIGLALRPALPPVSPPRSGPQLTPFDSRCEASAVSRASEAAPPQIYNALFDWLRGKETPGLQVIVETPSLPMLPLALASSARSWPTLSGDMRSALADGIDTCVVLDASSVPNGVEILDAKELRSPDTGRVDWDRLERRVPGAKAWLGLSQPLLSADRRDAVVYVARFGQGYSAGRYVWLHRDDDGQWGVRGFLTTWES